MHRPMTRHIKVALWILTMFALASYPSVGSAQTSFPTGPVRLLVTHSAGGSTDGAVRLVVPYLEEALGVPVIVENMPGAGGNVSRAYTYRAEPDGYTILGSQFPSMVMGQLISGGDFDTLAMTPVYQVFGDQAQSLAVSAERHPDVHTFDDAVRLAQSQRVTMAGPGRGTNGELAWAIFSSVGVTSVYIPVDSGREAGLQAAGGHTNLATLDTLSLDPMREEGLIRVLAVAGTERNSLTPDAPTVIELGHEGLGFDITIGFIGPPGIPDDILAVWERAFDQATSNPNFIRDAERAGFTPVPLGPRSFRQALEASFDLVNGFSHLFN